MSPSREDGVGETIGAAPKTVLQGIVNAQAS